MDDYKNESLELNGEEKAIMEKLGVRMHLVAFIMFGLSSFFLLTSIMRKMDGMAVGMLINAIVVFVIGWWTLGSSLSFRKAVKNNSRSELMEGLSDLLRLYTLQLVLFILFVALMAASALTQNG